MNNFLSQRVAWRLKAMRDLATASPEGLAIVNGSRNVCGLMAGGISGTNWAELKNARYLVALNSGFLRTQLTVLELAEESEVADATTLLRRNLEAMARIRELESGVDPATLFKKPPNVAALKGNARYLYGGYSEVAHSSHPRVAQLLGEAEDGKPGWVSLHPKFGEHTLVLITNAFVVLGEFYVWARELFPTLAKEFTFDGVDQAMSEMMLSYEAVSKQIEAMRTDEATG